MRLVLFMVLASGMASAEWVQLGSDIDGAAEGGHSGWSVSLSSDATRCAVGAPGHDITAGNDNTGLVRVHEWDAAEQRWVQLGQDIEGEAADDQSGSSVALSADGSRVAIGAPYNGVDLSGHVRVYQWDDVGQSWDLLGQDIDGETAYDTSGESVALSASGSYLAVGASGNDDNGGSSGHVRVYWWSDSTQSWVQVGQDIDGEAAGDSSGHSVALSSDGSRVAVGAPGNDFNGQGSGHVRVYYFLEITSTWVLLDPDIDGEASGDQSGWSVALSSDGSRVAVGAPFNDGDLQEDSGHVRVFEYLPLTNSWSRLGQDIDGEAAGDQSGWSVALSSDGSRVAVGADRNWGTSNSSGHVRVYRYLPAPNTWIRLDPDIDGEAAGDSSGYSVALSSDGTRVAIGAHANDGNGDASGHARVYEEAIFADGFESGNTSAWSS